MADLPQWARIHSSWKNAEATQWGWINSKTKEGYHGHKGLLGKLKANGWPTDSNPVAPASRKPAVPMAPVAKEETPKKKTAKTKSEK